MEGTCAGLLGDLGMGLHSGGLERPTTGSEQSSGDADGPENRSVRLVHADSEHRPRPPDGCAVAC
ncbi:hypothetical protein XHV734_3599 [Xanthomonas hortorum pv. vitians]|nr:hypothetical protein XHV734_3599 [Xanthomonas hortorum pv. vitians]